MEPVATLLALVERGLTERGATLHPPAQAERLAEAEAALGSKLAPSLRAFWERHDGAVAGALSVLSVADALERRAEAADGLLPVVEDGDRRFAADRQAADGDGEWPVIDAYSFDPEGTTFLRFLLAVIETDLARKVERDPEHAPHWVAWAESLESDPAAAEAVLQRGVLSARPVTTSLLLALGELAARGGRTAEAKANFEAAILADAVDRRDETARLDAAAERLVLARAEGDATTAERCLAALGERRASTAAVWRDELLHAVARADRDWARHALEVVRALQPDDADAPRLGTLADGVREAASLVLEGRGAIARGEAGKATTLMRRATNRAELAIAFAGLAEALDRAGQPGAVEAALQATRINPVLPEAWFELGEAHLQEGNDRAAERAFREVLKLDPAWALAHTKLAQVLIRLGRPTDAVEEAKQGVSEGEDPFFAQSILGDALFEAGEHAEAAAAYEEALRLQNEDHWTLHQAALATTEAGNYPRAADLYDLALRHNPDRCHRTLADYAELKRRMGRIGDAVKLYREAVKAAPDHREYKEMLREAQKELSSAPN
jgi:tetratricopeptide (TPR) repeat protein